MPTATSKDYREMYYRKDISGERFGFITVIGFSHRASNQSYWTCQCECGNITTVCKSSLIREKTRSCGCYRKQEAANKWLTHGETIRERTTLEYWIWSAMKQRCNTQTNKDYKYYGGRGIRVCKRWELYENFLEDMGRKPKGLSLDRIDNNGNYEPSNCRWATKTEQRNNQRLKSIIL